MKAGLRCVGGFGLPVVAAVSGSGVALAQNSGKAAVSPEAALEEKVMGSLASREMDGLLEYYFKKNNVPAEKQAAVKSIVAWRELSNPKLPNARRRALLQD